MCGWWWWVVVDAGNLFTLFFHDPLAGFCVVINKQAVTQEAYDKCTKYIQSSFDDVQKLLWNFPHIRTRPTPPPNPMQHSGTY